ncbi:LytTR family DNA-binding domain-containing protein [Paracrocinitomix mangrovi]|uniref:LytR/AlgR family response regulator transcription factor n=1 Tax=Paracrocinitomix mangrovi TaxID=2862509 RepID=UPI001C8E3ACE|nr:LytTR family DNA-binding domain-containing protein [Paracrocinitomix mangrovi]UKN03607.1 LytTR family DNA-binding domain-containing protein [Paracrocinitomix mangrovi]
METAVVVEDEVNVRIGIVSMIKDYCPDVDIVGEAGSVAEGFEKITQLNPDIVFLDINLPDGSGFDLLKKIVRDNLKVIFITAYGDHALKAIKYSAVDYLLKPLIPEELIEAVDKATKFVRHDKEFYELSSLSENQGQNAPNKIVIKTKTESYYLDIGSIVYCKADGNYAHIITTNQKPIMVAKTLKFYEEVLADHGFLRVHQSYLVNSKHIVGLQGNLLQLSNNESIEISRRKRGVILDLFK